MINTVLKWYKETKQNDHENVVNNAKIWDLDLDGHIIDPKQLETGSESKQVDILFG